MLMLPQPVTTTTTFKFYFQSFSKHRNNSCNKKRTTSSSSAALTTEKMPSTKWMKKKLVKSLPTGDNKTYEMFTQWRTHFLQATDNDRWGNKDVALNHYQSLIDKIQEFLRTGESSTNEMIFLTNEQKERASKTTFCIQCRLTALQYPEEEHWMTLQELMKLKPLFKNFYTWEGVFPVLMREEESSSKISLLSQDSGLSELLSSSDEEDCFEDNCSSNNNLLPKLPRQQGLKRLSVKILKFGIKNLSKVKDPYIVVTLRDRDSVNLTPSQVTGIASKIQDYHATFNTHIHVQRYMEKIPKGSALFFELKNSKDRETKYYAFLTNDNFVNGKGYLELYKGAADFHRKRLVKVSQTKPLYLHIEMTVHDN